MASYDNATGIHTMTINEAVSYLGGLPQNTKDTPYKVNIISNLDDKSQVEKMFYLLQKNNLQARRYLDLTPTQIIITPVCKTYAALFYEGVYLVKPPKFIANTDDFGTFFERIFYKCENLITPPEIPEGVKTIEGAFNGCKSLTAAPKIPEGVTNMESTFWDCFNLITPPEIPEGVTNMMNTFNNCKNLITAPRLPNSVTNMTFTFGHCEKIVTIPNIPNSVTNMFASFYGCSNLTTIDLTGCTVRLIDINMGECFHSCPKLKEFICDVEYEEKEDWGLYLFKTIGMGEFIINRYSLETNTFTSQGYGLLDFAINNELDLLSKSDELLIDSIGNITDQQVDLLLKTKMEFGDKYSLDPQKKWLVVWADNPDNVRSNCFVTQQELKELKALLKTKHPDLF